jgi:hypothetical protein
MRILLKLVLLAIVCSTQNSCKQTSKQVCSIPESLNSIKVGNASHKKLGFNTSNTFHIPLNEKDIELISSLHAEVLRFPGGTIGNFYHPTGGGYGLIPSEFEKLEGKAPETLSNQLAKFSGDSTNYLIPFIELAKQTNASVLLVANVITGTPQELEYLISILLQSNLKIEGVELGNELFLPAYVNYFPTANEYLNRITPFIEFLKANHPSIPYSIPVSFGHSGVKRATDWNSEIHDKGNSEYLSIHYYSDPSKKDYVEDYEARYKLLLELFPNKHFWLSEFNLLHPGKEFGNSHFQALQNSRLISHALVNSNELSLLIYHNLLGSDNAFSLLSKDKNETKQNYSFQSFSTFYKCNNQATYSKICDNSFACIQGEKNSIVGITQEEIQLELPAFMLNGYAKYKLHLFTDKSINIQAINSRTITLPTNSLYFITQ